MEGLIFGILRYFRGGNRDFRSDLGQSGLKGFRFQTGTDKCLRMKTVQKRYVRPSMFLKKKRKDIRFQIKMNTCEPPLPQVIIDTYCSLRAKLCLRVGGK